jgi:hypothetical protein
MKTAKDYAAEIYRSFCKDGSACEFQEKWDNYTDRINPIESGSPADLLILAAMQYAIEQYQIAVGDED